MAILCSCRRHGVGMRSSGHLLARVMQIQVETSGVPLSNYREVEGNGNKPKGMGIRKWEKDVLPPSSRLKTI